MKLPIQDLLLAQRVCSRFKATIDGSIKIRRALFFAPEPVAKEWEAVPRMNPLLTQDSQFRRRRFLFTEVAPGCGRYGEKCAFRPTFHIKGGGVRVECKHIVHFLYDAAYFSHGSWKEMLVAQSPKWVHVKPERPHWIRRDIYPQSAPTIGEVCKVAHGKRVPNVRYILPASHQGAEGLSDYPLAYLRLLRGTISSEHTRCKNPRLRRGRRPGAT